MIYKAELLFIDNQQNSKCGIWPNPVHGCDEPQYDHVTWTGELGTVTAAAAVRGQKVEAVVDTGTAIVTKENADKF